MTERTIGSRLTTAELRARHTDASGKAATVTRLRDRIDLYERVLPWPALIQSLRRDLAMAEAMLRRVKRGQA